MNKKQILAAMLGVLTAVPGGALLAQQPVNPGNGFQVPPAASQQPTQRAAAQSVLRTVTLPPYLLNDIANSMGLKYGRMPGVTVTSDPAQGHLIIMAPQDIQQRIDGEIRHMLSNGYVQRVGRQVSIASVSRQFPLRQISWREFEDGLQTLAGQPLQSTTRRNGELAAFELVDQPIGQATVEVDRRANSVTVLAPEPTMAGWQKLVSALDTGSSDPNNIMQMAKLRNAEPAPIQRAIQLLRQLPASGNAGSTVGVAGQGVRFTTAAQEGGAAPQAGGNQGGDQNNDNVVAIDGGDAGGLIGNVQIEFVPELGILIVRGPKRDVQRVMSVIDEIEAKAELTQPQIDIHTLKHVDCDAMAELVTQLYTDVLSDRGSELSITSLGRPNALLLIGRDAAIQSAKELIERLDAPVSPTSQLKVFRLQNASAVDAEESIRTFFNQEPGGDEGVRPGLGTRIRIIADYRTNSLIIQAAPRDMSQVARLIADLDVDSVPMQHVVKIFPLQNALADDLATVLQSAISGGESTDDNFSQPSTTLSLLTRDSETGQAIESGLLAGLSVTADPNSNSLVVRGPSNTMPLIEELIEQLDQLPGAESMIKVFQLEFGDANAVSQALTQLFTSQQQGGGFGATNSSLNVPQISAGNENSLVQLRFSVDGRTNSVIAVGSESDLEVVESVVLRLDIEGFSTRQTEVIWLRNASALSVATAIQQYVQLRTQTTQQFQQTLQTFGVYEFVDRDLIVVAEEISNSLLISVSPRLYDTVRRMIDQLDRRPPDVMVKVILAEVTLGDGFEWGSEFGVQDSLLFDRGVTGTGSAPGFNFNGNGTPNLSSAGRNDLATQSLSTFGLARSSSAFGYGGFVFAAASDSVSLLLRSLQDANRAQILSRPIVMARDNTEGLVQVGQTIPRVTGVNQNGGVGGTQIVTEDEDIGLILRILPRVGSDGTIRLEVDAERSALDPSEGIPVGFGNNDEPILSPIINRTRAQTTVTAYDGQTVVLGGLIQKTRNQFSRRIPYVSNIPYLGMLFRYDQELETRSELLIIMTPQIVSTEEDWEYQKHVESSRMSWCLADVVEMHGDVGLNGGYGLWGPAIGPMIYPDATPMIDDIRMEHGVQPIIPNQIEMVPQPSPEAGASIIQGPAGAQGSSNMTTSGPVNVQPGSPIDPRSATPGLIEPVYPVAPTSGIQQVRHESNGRSRQNVPQRIPTVRR